MVEYLRRNTIYQGVLLQSVYGQLPPRSWSTIGCHYSPQSLSSAATRIHHELPPRSWSTTTARCQHDKGSAIIVTTSQRDTESAILDPPLRSLIREIHLNLFYLPTVDCKLMTHPALRDVLILRQIKIFWIPAWKYMSLLQKWFDRACHLPPFHPGPIHQLNPQAWAKVVTKTESRLSSQLSTNSTQGALRQNCNL